MQRISKDIDSIKSEIEEGIILPYLRSNIGDPEVGYCKINSANEVVEKYMLNEECKDISIIPYVNSKHDINISPTRDGYVRFWTSSTELYMRWKYDRTNEIMKLVVMLRKHD